MNYEPTSTLDVVEVLMWIVVVVVLLLLPILFIGWLDVCQSIIRTLGW